MKTYIFKVINSSHKNGYNQTIEVFRVKHNKPEIIGRNDMISTASSIGATAQAKKLIASIEGYKFVKFGYDFVNPENINVFEV